MQGAVETLLNILNLETLDQNSFRGQSGNTLWQRVFGGHVIAQALVAADRTVDETRYVHSLHAYFILPGDPKTAIDYKVERLRDGRSFSTRRVVAYQHERAIFSLSASFQIDEEGLDHFIPMPEGIPAPDELETDPSITETLLTQMPPVVQNYWKMMRPFHLRPISLEHYMTRNILPPRQGVWFKLKETLGDDRRLNTAILAYLTDMTLLDTALFAHGRSVFDADLQIASIDHALWFHRPFRFDDWMFYYQDSPSTSGSRGFSRGSIYTREGTLIASVAQEGLTRLREEGLNPFG